MSERVITCDGCETVFELPPGFADPTVLCPSCAKQIDLSRREETPATNGDPQQPQKRQLKVKLQQAPEDSDRYKACPQCNARWGQNVVICTSCGYNWEKSESQSTLMRRGWVLLIALLVLIGVLLFFVYKAYS